MRYPACRRCHRKLRSGDYAWVVAAPASHVARDGTVSRFTVDELICDDCGRAA